MTFFLLILFSTVAYPICIDRFSVGIGMTADRHPSISFFHELAVIHTHISCLCRVNVWSILVEFPSHFLRAHQRVEDALSHHLLHNILLLAPARRRAIIQLHDLALLQYLDGHGLS